MKILHSRIGKVFLVGAGPGDPDLITRKGARALEESDVVIYHRLADERLLELAPPLAERISVGKKGGCYTFPQERINELLVRHALDGKQVTRLKGGDPFLFGRGAEEALHLAERNIPFEVIPGVSSALAVPAAAGIPLTHRGVSTAVTIVTGRLRDGSDFKNYWRNWRLGEGTLVVLMPLGTLRAITRQLVLNGWPLDTPAAMISAGTLKNQRTVFGSLRDIHVLSKAAGLESPALLVAGPTVGLAARLGGLEATAFARHDRLEIQRADAR